MTFPNHGLPPRPEIENVAGPSRDHRTQPTSYPKAASQPSGRVMHHPQPYQMGVNQPYMTPYVNQVPYIQSYSYPQSPAYPVPFPQQSFGQSLFQPFTQPGYAYPQPYPVSYQQPLPSAEPPNKRPRLSAPGAEIQTSFPGSQSDSLAWRNCSHPGCQFVGPGDKVEEHEGDRHLIFRHGRPVERSEEEERYAKHKGPPPPVYGTNITLHTEEDISKWIAERKAKWPSAQRIAAKDELRQAAIARGENPDGRGRGGARGRGSRRMDAASRAEDWGRVEVDPATHAGDSRGRGRGRGSIRGEGGRGRGMGQHRGGGRGGHHSSHGRDHQASVTGSNNIPVAEAAADAEARRILPTSTGKLTPATGLIEYESSISESDSSSLSSSPSDSDTDSESEDAESGMEEEPAEASNHVKQELEAPSITQPEANDNKPVCRFFRKSGKCKFGDKCRFSHTPEAVLPGERTEPHQPTTESSKKEPRAPPQKRPNPFARPSMLSQLLANPIQNTLSQLTQTIRFLVANDMLAGVELIPGQAEEAARQRDMVTVVSEESIADETAAGDNMVAPEGKAAEDPNDLT